MIYPHLFLKAINAVGGVGIDLSFGILPGALLIKYSRGKKRAYGYFIVACFEGVLFYELDQELGLLLISLPTRNTGMLA